MFCVAWWVIWDDPPSCCLWNTMAVPVYRSKCSSCVGSFSSFIFSLCCHLCLESDCLQPITSCCDVKQVIIAFIVKLVIYLQLHLHFHPRMSQLLHQIALRLQMMLVRICFCLTLNRLKLKQAFKFDLSRLFILMFRC